MAIRPRVFTIPPSAPFLPTLFQALAAGRIVPGFPDASDPLAWASATLYLPTRRACRLARDLFLDALGVSAAVLPRLVPLGDVDEDELAFAEAAGPLATENLELPPALDGLERRLLLTKLVLKWTAALVPAEGAALVPHSTASALTLADNLARFIDDMTTRQVDWAELDRVVPHHLDKYWQLTLRFLGIAREAWPAILAEHGAIEPAARRDRLLAAEAARLAKIDTPVIAAGSTGSIPATATLLAAIARMPNGAVVLPGLDTDLDEAAWQLIGGRSDDGRATTPAVGHPQFAMHGLLQRLGIDRSAVEVLGEARAPARTSLISHALCPAAASECWQKPLPHDLVLSALGEVAVIEAMNAEEEALAIAVVLREAMETPGKTAALITPDRGLARRVKAALARWSITADDSGGDALADTPAGRFAGLAAETALGGVPPVPLLALLKHPLTHLGLPRWAVEALERAVLRGPRPRAGTSGLAQALARLREEQSELHRRDPRTRLSSAELDAAAALVEALAAALAPLEHLGSEPLPFNELAARHWDVVVRLAGGKPPAGSDGEALASAFSAIAGAAAADIPVVPTEYSDVFRAAISDRVVRRPEQPGVRVHIFGLLEARLQSVDLLVLGGLNEGTWPPEAHSDPWLSRPMRLQLGLDLPERRIGLTAHDFAQALGAPCVVLTRAAKVAGAPTLPSRFLQRLAAVAGSEPWGEALARGTRYLALARALDAPTQVAPCKRPAPRPPRTARPSSLSVTDIEHWLRDPYTIYAKHILRLYPLDPVDTAPGAADRGSAIHGAIGEFTKTFAAQLPPDPLAELLAIGRKHFAALDDYPEARAFWWPRFVRIAQWFVAWEVERRRAAAAIHAEIHGEIHLALGERTFRLHGIADRIETFADGRCAILDYKTGQTPTEPQVRSGLAPQLTLEAAILRNGGFPGIPAGARAAELAYVQLRGRDPAGELKPLEFKNGTPDHHADQALRRLTKVAQRFEDEATPYCSLVHPMWRTRYGDYDHLARVKEWSLTGGEPEEIGE
jgi:ATP-dependent helicase/nuclease subunit B